MDNLYETSSTYLCCQNQKTKYVKTLNGFSYEEYKKCVESGADTSSRLVGQEVQKCMPFCNC